MTKLDKLINELCPNGVEYKTLGENGTIFGSEKRRKKDNVAKT